MEDEGWAGYIWDRSTIRFAIVLAALVIFAIFTGISSYHYHQNDLKRQYLERTASEILGTKVTIGALIWRRSEHTVVLTDIEIANPPGFDIPTALQILAIRMRMDSDSFTSMVFSQVMISHSVINLTFGRDVSNLMVLHANTVPTTPVLTADGKPVTVMIKEVATSAGMSVKPDVVPSDRPLSASDVEPLHFAVTGEKEKGVPVAQAVTMIFDQIIRGAFMAEAQAGALEPMSNSAIHEISTSFDMAPDFVGLASHGPVTKPKTDKRKERHE